MAKAAVSRRTSRFERGLLPTIIVVVAAAVFLLTWIVIRASRTDSYSLLVTQATAFTEVLAQACENTIVAESYYDRLAQSRYRDIVASLDDLDITTLRDGDVARFSRVHDFAGIWVFDMQGEVKAEGSASGGVIQMPAFVTSELKQLAANPDTRSVLLLDAPEGAEDITQYYLQVTNQLNRIVVIANDARAYADAVRTTGIGFLVQNMSKEEAVEYIVYQTKDGIVFSSRRSASLLSIDSDPFLGEALESDTVMNRVFEFQDRPVLELVRPFSSTRYPFGLLRVGWSLNQYYSISRAFDIQMAVMGATFFGLLLLAILYLNSRRQRTELGQRYIRIKSLTDKVLEQMHSGVAAIDRRGVIRITNRAFDEIMGVSQPVDQSWRDLMASRNPVLIELLENPRSATETELTIVAESVTKVVLAARTEIEGADEDQPSTVIVVTDITRLREFEKAAARKERLSEMGHLAAGVAHEIRNPLNTIAIAAQRLESEFAPADRGEEYLAFTERIRSETRRLNDIVTRFLALTREAQPRQASVIVSDLLVEMGKRFGEEVAVDGIEISVETLPGLVVAGDIDKLKQALLNLFNNARESFDGRPGKIVLRAARADAHAVVTMADSGPGIPPDLREKIFTPYFTTKPHGTGLGLPIVYQIITEAGGTIRVVDSELGGASFVITLPVLQA